MAKKRLSDHDKKIEELAAKEKESNHTVRAAHIKGYEGKRPKPIGKDNLVPDLEISTKGGKLLKIIEVDSKTKTKRDKKQIAAFKKSATLRGAKFEYHQVD